MKPGGGATRDEDMGQQRVILWSSPCLAARRLGRYFVREGWHLQCVESLEELRATLWAGGAIPLIVLGAGVRPLSFALRSLSALATTAPVLALVRSGESGEPVSPQGLLVEYLCEPVRVAEVAFRVDTLHVRAHCQIRYQSSLGRVTLDALKRQVRVDERELEVTPAEWSTLALLLDARGLPVAASTISREVLGFSGQGGGARNVVSSLRKKLQSAGLGDPVRTLRGRGYALVPEAFVGGESSCGGRS